MSEQQVINSEATNMAQKPSDTQAHWGGVFAMTLCVFALIASEFMPVSLLTAIAQDLNITEGMVGQGIAISGAFAVVTSLSITSIAGNFDRKYVLLMLTAVMLVSGAIISSASTYTIYMIGRALIGISIGGFWSLSAACAIRLVPEHQVPKALAIFNGGNALAMVIAAPIGSYLGSVIGWRGAFFCLVPISLIALAWQFISLPSMKNDNPNGGFGQVFGILRAPVVRIGMVACGLFFMGQFTLYTYVRPFLETVTLLDAQWVSWSLLIVGVSGFVGTATVGKFLDKSLYGTIIIIPIIMASIGVALIAFGATYAAVALLLAMWGFFATAAPVGWWTWIAKTLPEDSESGGGLMVAIIQLSIALGSTCGGLLYDYNGHGLTFSVSTAILLAASLIAFASYSYSKK
ncbi:MFS transporter [Photobacterium rosenbergii]|uniref:MFS transporter n=1 Tax=Photobacterium rosenbergii TaxID=294936 RepID=A0ABU3ZNC4_9GAMM|nr:MFS transporter [Photobacterium rosenbergii]MDV5171600.1 MFS transporter [Photobacterium rosenbergii]